jgi:hypothetical protein
MLLETPKLETRESLRLSDVDPLDAMNLSTLRALIDHSSPKTSASKR